MRSPVSSRGVLSRGSLSPSFGVSSRSPPFDNPGCAELDPPLLTGEPDSSSKSASGPKLGAFGKSDILLVNCVTTFEQRIKFPVQFPYFRFCFHVHFVIIVSPQLVMPTL